MPSVLPASVPVDAISALVQEDIVQSDESDWSDANPSVSRADLPRLRPILVALSARTAGATHVSGAAQTAAEYLHRGLILHDMALGREGGRRRRVVRRVLKKSVSMLTGHHMSLRALELARVCSPSVFDAALDTLREFADGHALSRTLQRGMEPTYDDWFEHANHHTGALFAFCCKSGALLGQTDGVKHYALSRYGRHLGRLWHAAEDVAALRHLNGPEHLLRCASAGRPVLAVICAAQADPSINVMWLELVHNGELATAETLCQGVLATNGIPRAAEIMVRESWSARKAVQRLTPSPYRDALDELARGLGRAGLSTPE